MSGRYVTDEPIDPAQRFAVYRLCDCTTCAGSGKVVTSDVEYKGRDGITAKASLVRCFACRGEGRTRDLVATCATPEALGVTLYTLALEGEFDECPIGILDRIPEPGNSKWLVKPWLPSARNVSDAGRTLARSKHGR